MVATSFVLWHDLYEQRPAREVAAFDAFVQIALMSLMITGDKLSRFSIGKVLNVLLGFKCKLDPEAFICGIEKTEGGLPKPCMCLKLEGMPRSLITLVT